MDVDIAIVGSLNHDLTVVAPHLPRPGETVLGNNHYWDNGGKGANQAAAAARLGASVAMFGLVGDDEHGESLVDGLTQEGIDTAGVGIDHERRTGLAVITVDDEAENTIVVSPGANSALTAGEIESHRSTIADAKVLLAQLEVPAEAVASAVEICRGIICLNPAPAQALPIGLFERIDVLIPNRSELAALADVTIPTNRDETLEAISCLPATGAVVVTLGSDGALVVESGESALVPSHAVSAIDPTGAGDAFCGALAFALSRDRDLLEATKWAVAVGALATTRQGAQASMPTAAEVETFLNG